MSEVTVVTIGSVGGIPALASDADTPLLWLLVPDAVPEDGALDALLEHAPVPAASLVVDGQGSPVEPLLGRFTEGDVEGLLDGAARHRVPLRHCPVTSLLVQRELVRDLPGPDTRRFGPYAGNEWTARLFARSAGFLVPASRVKTPGPPKGSPWHALRVAPRAGWRRGETVREVAQSAAARLP